MKNIQKFILPWHQDLICRSSYASSFCLIIFSACLWDTVVAIQLHVLSECGGRYPPNQAYKQERSEVPTDRERASPFEE